MSDLCFLFPYSTGLEVRDEARVPLTDPLLTSISHRPRQRHQSISLTRLTPTVTSIVSFSQIHGPDLGPKGSQRPRAVFKPIHDLIQSRNMTIFFAYELYLAKAA